MGYFLCSILHGFFNDRIFLDWKNSMKSKECQLNVSMIKLWSDYIFYMRSFIVSSVDKSPDIQFISIRLEQNQNDIGNLFGTVYSEYNGNRFSELLKEHMSLSIEFVNSTIRGDIEDSVSHKMRCYMNVMKIVDFLSAIDNFDRPYLRGLFFDHLHLTEEYLMTRIHKDYSNSIKSFDNWYDQVVLITDVISDTMIRRL